MIFDEIKNKKANFKYFIEETYEAGMILLGWESKSIAQKKVNLDNSYVVVKAGELYLLNSLISPNESASTHVDTDQTRTRKLLMNKNEINKLIGLVDQKGFTLIPLKIVRKRGKFKLIFGLAKGKKDFDKRNDKKEADWSREKEQLMKHKIKSN